eukprot:10354995-Alexandrium_andersonii.AAC.1
MSASLVGSEMCIRDRNCGRPTPRDFLRLLKLAHAKQEVQDYVWLLRVCPCLLYTSDAADDM